MSNSSDDETSDFDYQSSLAHRRKRRRIQKSHDSEEPIGKALPEVTPDSLIEPIITVLESDAHALEDGEISFEQYIGPLLLEYSRAVLGVQEQHASSGSGSQVSERTTYPLSRMQARRILTHISQSDRDTTSDTDATSALFYRKLKVDPSPLRTLMLKGSSKRRLSASLTPMTIPHRPPPVNQDVLDALYNIRTTPYASSFLSRLRGFESNETTGVIACDWDAKPPWVDLLSDIHDHYALRHPEDEHAVQLHAPIEYSSLCREHLPQVHDLLTRAFWSGIDVTDSLEYSPEKCTIIATYKRMVIGAAFLSSPQETYITYLAVKPGFDNARVATSMLFHLISLHPHKDITLHVSTTNPAMLLYNRFGFKAEEFIVGFYEDYIESQTRGSKNAFRLRLRQ